MTVPVPVAPVQHSDFIMYVDESGDHSLSSIDPEYPLFVLSFCIFRKDEYVQRVTPALRQLTSSPPSATTWWYCTRWTFGAGKAPSPDCQRSRALRS